MNHLLTLWAISWNSLRNWEQCNTCESYHLYLKNWISLVIDIMGNKLRDEMIKWIIDYILLTYIFLMSKTNLLDYSYTCSLLSFSIVNNHYMFCIKKKKDEIINSRFWLFIHPQFIVLNVCNFYITEDTVFRCRRKVKEGTSWYMKDTNCH